MQRTDSLTKKGKELNLFATVLIFLIVVTSIFASSYLYWKKEQVTQKYVSELKSLNKKTMELKLALTEEKKEKEKRELELQEVYNKQAHLEAELTKTKSELEKAYGLKGLITERFTLFDNALKEKWNNMESLLGMINKEVQTLASVNTKFITDSDRFKNSTKRMDEKDTVDLPPVIVKESQIIAQPKEPSSGYGEEKLDQATKEEVDTSSVGKVMSINLEHNFVVLNKGLVDGVAINQAFNVMQNGEIIGNVIVSEVRDFVSLGMIDSLKEGFTIKKGDNLL